MAGLRLIFMGTPDFSVPVLEGLIEAGHDVVCVYAQPPRPAGRGQKERLTPVHTCAEAHGIEVRTPISFKKADVQEAFARLNADVAIVVAYGLILPKAALDAPRFGCINIHASLLPRWRGAAPIQRAIQAGDAKSGVTIMQMDEGLDTGDMLAVSETVLTSETTAGMLHDALSQMGAELIVKVLDDLSAGHLEPVKQPAIGVTYATKLEKAEGRINWMQTASEIDALVRAFTPWPGVWFEYQNERIKVFSVARIDLTCDAVPGTVLDDKLTVACGEGAVQITELQRAGKKRAKAEDVLRGFPIEAGSVFSRSS